MYFYNGIILYFFKLYFLSPALSLFTRHETSRHSPENDVWWFMDSYTNSSWCLRIEVWSRSLTANIYNKFLHKIIRYCSYIYVKFVMIIIFMFSYHSKLVWSFRATCWLSQKSLYVKHCVLWFFPFSIRFSLWPGHNLTRKGKSIFSVSLETAKTHAEFLLKMIIRR